MSYCYPYVVDCAWSVDRDMSVRLRLVLSSHFNRLQPTSPCPQHGCTPDKTLPHESDDEDCECADTNPMQDAAAANSESTNDVVPMSLSVNNLKQEMSPLPDQAMYVRPNANKRKYQMSAVMSAMMLCLTCC